MTRFAIPALAAIACVIAITSFLSAIDNATATVEAGVPGGTPAELAARSSALVVARHETTRRIAAHPDAVGVRLRSSR